MSWVSNILEAKYKFLAGFYVDLSVLMIILPLGVVGNIFMNMSVVSVE